MGASNNRLHLDWLFSYERNNRGARGEERLLPAPSTLPCLVKSIKYEWNSCWYERGQVWIETANGGFIPCKDEQISDGKYPLHAIFVETINAKSSSSQLVGTREDVPLTEAARIGSRGVCTGYIVSLCSMRLMQERNVYTIGRGSMMSCY